MATTTMAELAQAFSDAFERGERDQPNEFGDRAFYKLKEGAPEWMHRAVQEAHCVGGELLMPNDWIYDACDTISGRMADSDPERWDDAAAEWADSGVDVYNADRTKWLASHLFWAGVVDEAVEELGHSDQGIFGDIGIGQYHALSHIAAALIQAVREQAEEDAETDAD